MRTALGLAPIFAALVAFEVYCLIEIVLRPTRYLPKWVWAIVCLASVPLGGVVYLVIGRGDPTTADAVTAAGSTAPAPTLRSSPASARSIDRVAPAALTTDGLIKHYREHDALAGISICVPTGSVFGLVGPNGAGKTTLLAILAGLRHPSSGTVSFADRDSRVALLPDTPHFEPWLTAWEVVDLARQLTVPTSSSRATTDALARAGLLEVSHRRTGGFSRGMLQRLGLAATIVGDPDILLLDEPCSALDPLGRREVLDLVGRLGGDHTVLFCSHILDDVQEVCDRVGVLHDGQLLFQGELNELLVGHAAPTYTIRLRPPLGPVVAALDASPWVRTVEQVGAEELRVTVDHLRDAEEHLAATLADAGARVVSFVPAGADLEQVFLELIR